MAEPSHPQHRDAVGRFVPAPAPGSQPVVIAGTITQSHTTAAHLATLQQRRGRNGQDVVLFSRPGHAVDPVVFAQAAATDREHFLAARQRDHQYRMTVQLERQHAYFPMQPYIETLMARVARDLGRPIDWVAAIPHDTHPPQAQIVIRGRDRNNTEFSIQPDYLAHGVRHRASEIATWLVGPVQEQERLQTREGPSAETQQPAPLSRDADIAFLQDTLVQGPFQDTAVSADALLRDLHRLRHLMEQEPETYRGELLTQRQAKTHALER